MHTRTRLALTFVLLLTILPACGSQPPDRDTQATPIAAEIFATQTAAVPRSTATHTLRPTAMFTPTLLPSAIPTSTPTALASATLIPTATSAAPAPPDPELPAVAWPVAFAEAFDGNGNDWPAGAERNEYVANTWRVTGGKYRWQARAYQDVHWYVHPDIQPLSDLYLAVDVQQISGPLSGEYGVVYRLRDEDNFYMFCLSDARRYTVWIKYRGDWEQLVDGLPSPAIRPGEVNRIIVVAEGAYMSFYANGELLAEVDDDRLARGKVGVTMELHRPGDVAVWEFDDLTLRAPATPTAGSATATPAPAATRTLRPTSPPTRIAAPTATHVPTLTPTRGHPALVKATITDPVPCTPWDEDGCEWSYVVTFTEVNRVLATIDRIGQRYTDTSGTVWMVGVNEWFDRTIVIGAGGSNVYESWVRTKPGDPPDLRGGRVTISWEGHDAAGNPFTGHISAGLAWGP